MVFASTLNARGISCFRPCPCWCTFRTEVVVGVERRFLRPGMVVLDIGAHNGFYTMLAARRVGNSGQVIAFEPSPREHKRLFRHLKMNRLLANVVVCRLALDHSKGEDTLFVVEGRDIGCNS